MKKIVALLLVFATMFALPACGKNSTQAGETTQITLTEATDPTEPEGVVDTLHEHSYTTQITPPTCTADGYTTYSCSCSEHYISDKVAAPGHSFGEWVTTLVPTETATGLSERQCSVCNTAESRVLGMLIADHVHSYVETVLSGATCTKEGQKRYSCNCGETYTQMIGKEPHAYNDVLQNPDCVNGGYTTHTCSVCGDSYVDTYTNALDHAYSVKIIPATCQGKGRKTTTCTRCNEYQKTENLPKIDHTYTQATCTQPSACSQCNKLNANALGHSYGSDHLCTRCGASDPKYQVTGSATYTVTVCSDKGVLLSGITVSVYVGDTKVGSGTTDNTGVAKMTLSGTGSSYKLVLSGVPEDYEVKESYTYSSITVRVNLKTVPVLDPNDHSRAQYSTGSVMANFVLTDVDGNVYDLSQLRQEKKLIILDFWYVACSWCREEFPIFEETLQQYSDDVVFLAVNPYDTMDKIREAREEDGVTFPMVQDTVNLHQGFDVSAYPTTVFIDSTGKIVSIHSGVFDDKADFVREIEKYLR